jgi:alanyl-tRNA synthetase
MTERLYYSDCYLTEFRARVVDADDSGKRLYLDRTAFYPTSGGQPFDLGTLDGASVVEVVDDGERVAHVLDAPLSATEVDGRVNWRRRFDHMQQHTGQHLLSAVFEELYQMRTLSFHMGAEVSTIELGAASLSAAQIERVEDRCAAIIAEARPVVVTFEDAEAAAGLRKESQRTGTLRIVSIEGLDRSACGGTHVRSTAEIGLVLTRKLDKVRNNVRIEFVCGQRALAQARTDYRILAAVGRALSSPFERAPDLIASQAERIKTLEKTCQRQATELAVREGRELHAATAPDNDGLRRVTQHAAIDEAMRARAQAFVGGGKAAFLAVCADPPSVLLAASADSGIHAGDRVKAAVISAGGRGGGNANLAQGSVPDVSALNAVTEALSTAQAT